MNHMTSKTFICVYVFILLISKATNYTELNYIIKKSFSVFVLLTTHRKRFFTACIILKTSCCLEARLCNCTIDKHKQLFIVAPTMNMWIPIRLKACHKNCWSIYIHAIINESQVFFKPFFFVIYMCKIFINSDVYNGNFAI